MPEEKHKSRTDKPINPPDVPLEDKQRQLEGRQADDQQSAFVDKSETDDLGELTATDLYEAELAAGASDDVPNDPESLEMLTEREIRSEETADAFEAAEEGLGYVPPIDPPTMPSDDYESASIASGIGPSALSDAYDAQHHSTALPDADEVTARVYEALRADSSTSPLADKVVVNTRGDTVIVRGSVADLDDSNNVVAVAKYVHGVAEVIDELQVCALEK
jgi:hypothetical protein